MQIVPYLSFDGNCREAFEFYAKALKGNIEFVMTIGESPFAAHHPPEAHDRIMHVRLVSDSATLMGGDAPPGAGKKPQGFCISINVNEAAEADRIFQALSDGGKIDMPIAQAFWADRFGMCTDKFGTPWMVNGNLRDPA